VLKDEAVGHGLSREGRRVLGAEPTQLEAAEEAILRPAVPMGLVRQARPRVDVRVDREVADVGEPRVVEDRRADEDAEAPAANEAEPMAKLHAEALQPELLDAGDEGLLVAGAHCRAQPLELGRSLPQLPRRPPEGEGLLERIFDLDERELAAEPQAEEHAAPAAEEEADEVAELGETGGLDHGSKLVGVALA